MPTFDVEGARKAGYSDDEIITQLAKDRNFNHQAAMVNGYTKDEVLKHLAGDISTVPQAPVPGQAPSASFLASQVPPRKQYSTREVLDFLRPMVSAGVGALGATAALPTAAVSMGAGPVAAGVGAYALTDRMMQKAITGGDTSKETPSPIFGQRGSLGSLEEGITNEIGGAVTRGLFRGAKELINKGSVVGPLAKLDATFSMYYQKAFGDKSSVSKWIEDIFASGSKAKAIENSASRAMEAAGAKNFNAQDSAAGIRKDLVGITRDFFNESEVRAITAKAIAKKEVAIHHIPNPVQPQASGLLGPNGQPLPTAISTIPMAIEGPINTPNARAAAQSYLTEREQDITRGLTPSPNQRELMNTAQDIISKTTIKDEKGKVIGNIPLSFDDAWKLKRASDVFTISPSKGADIVTPGDTSGYFKDISKSLNHDIEASISNWKSDPNGIALNAWKNAKATVQQRLDLLNLKGDKSLSALINGKQTALPALESLIKDPEQLQRALNAGEVTFPGGQVIKSNNLRADLQGYRISSLMQENYQPDAIIANRGRINMDSLMSTKSGQWNDPAMLTSDKKLFGAQARSDIDMFFKGVAQTQMKQQTSIVGNPKLWAIHGIVNLTAGLIGGFTHGIPGGLTAISAVRLSAGALGKLLTGKNTARLMVAMANGEALGMSEQAASRLITGAIQGSLVTLIDSKGKEVSGSIDKEGKFSLQ